MHNSPWIERRWRRVMTLASTCALILTSAAPGMAQEPRRRSSFLHGTGRAVGGVLLDFPRTVIEVATPAPPLVTAGAVAGLIRAGDVAFHGLKEMNETFDPWGIKKRQRASQAAPTTARPNAYVTPGFDTQ